MKIIVMILCSALLLTQLGGFPPITPENAAQLREVRRIGNGTIQEVAWSPDGQTLAVGGTTGVWLYTAGDLQQAPRLLDGHTERILTLAFSPDGSRLATGSADRNTIVWDLATGSILATLSGQSSQGEAGGGTDWVRAVAFHPDGQRIAVARIYGMVELWNPQTGEITPGPQFFCGARVAYAMVFSADGTRLFSACNADWSDFRVGGISVWNLITGEETVIATTPAYGIALHPDGNHIAYSQETFQADMSEVQIYDLSTGQATAICTASADNYFTHGNNVAFNADGSLLAAACSEGLLLWDVAAGVERERLTNRPVTGVAFSPDGRLLVVSESADIRDTNSALSVWDVRTGERITRLVGHRLPVDTLAFSPDGTLIASGGQDGTIRLWAVGK